MPETYFDRLPVELLHEIFSYFWCHEIFRSFYSINEYISYVMTGYDLYFLDLSSEEIGKREFDLICSLVRPKQIIGLKLGKNLFNIFAQYLIARDHLESFTRLRSFWIDRTVSYDEKLSNWLNSKIDFNNLLSLRFDGYLFLEQHNISKGNLSHLDRGSPDQFRRCSIITLTYLTNLDMIFDSFDDLNCLVGSNSNQFISLGIRIRYHLENVEQFSSFFRSHQWTQLIQFNLNLEGLFQTSPLKTLVNLDFFSNICSKLPLFLGVNNVQWKTIVTILSPMSKLKYLTLIFFQRMLIYTNLSDGKKWKIFLSTTLKYLKKFSFKLPVREESDYEMQKCLNRFRSSWWLKKKKWLIEYSYQDRSLITVPDFAPTIFDNSIVKSYDMMFYPRVFYSNIKELKLNFVRSNNLNELLISSNRDQVRFPNVKRLSLNGHLTNEISNQISTVIDLLKIEHLQISSKIDDYEAFLRLIVLQMTNLSSLHIQSIHNRHFFPFILSPFNSMRELILIVEHKPKRKSFFSNLCRLFPRLTRLTTPYHSRTILCYLINQLLYLEQINLPLNYEDHPPNYQWIEQNTRLINHSFQSDIFNINYKKERIFMIWINHEENMTRTSSTDASSY